MLVNLHVCTGRREQPPQFQARLGGRQFRWRRIYRPARSIAVWDRTQAICRGTSHQHSSRRWKIQDKLLSFAFTIIMTIKILVLNLHQFGLVLKSDLNQLFQNPVNYRVIDWPRWWRGRGRQQWKWREWKWRRGLNHSSPHDLRPDHLRCPAWFRNCWQPRCWRGWGSRSAGTQKEQLAEARWGNGMNTAVTFPLQMSYFWALRAV